MNPQELHELLVNLGACSEAVQYADGKSLAQAWQKCERVDWMLWLCGKMVGKQGWPTHKALVFAACQCARTALPYVQKGDLRPLHAIETTERWVAGLATLKQVQTAAYAAYVAAADAYANAASGAACAAAYAATDAACAAAYAADAAYAAGLKERTQRELADIVRHCLRLEAQ